VVVEGAVRAPIVFDNGDDLVVAQAPDGLNQADVAPTLEQLAANLRGAGRSSSVVQIRLRALESAGDGSTRPIVLGETLRDFRSAPIR
jgi:hypothetical protein